MSGTSLDGIDVALIKTDGESLFERGPSATYPYDQVQQAILRQALVDASEITQRKQRPANLGATVSTLVWKNLIMHPVFGLFAGIQTYFGVQQPFDWFARVPLLSVGLIVAWQWLPYAALILLTALQSLDEEQKDASEMDGADSWSYFRYIVMPHLARPITVVILIETIFLLNIFAEIKVATVGGLAGNLTYLVFSQLNDATDVGMAAAGGLVAVVLANIVSAFLVRIVGRNLEA